MMTSRLLVGGWIACASLVASFGIPTQAADPLAVDPSTLEQVTQRIGQAIHAEIEGDFLRRAKFLEEAEQLQAQFAPVHWYSGRVLGDDGKWLSIDEAVDQARSCTLLAEYETMRQQQPASLQGNWLFSRRRYQNNSWVVPVYDSVAVVSDIQKASCFVADTQINTLRGLQAIETLEPGDLVLARDVTTGELAYKPVVCRTMRAPSKTVLLTVNNETIHSTTSHLLWASGKGWTKAGDLQPGDVLHSTAEPAVVMSSTPGESLPTHNLVVADVHTYFVGSSRVLSHDVLPRGSVHERVPGEFSFSTGE